MATDKVLCPALMENITRNLCSCTVEVSKFEWYVDIRTNFVAHCCLTTQFLNRGSDIQVGLPTLPFDVVLCSDVLYEPIVYDRLLDTLRSLNYKTGIIVYKIRNPRYASSKYYFEVLICTNREELDFFRSVSSWADVKVCDKLFPCCRRFIFLFRWVDI